MPRSMAPPPSAEFSVVLSKGFGKTPTEKIEILGEPNRFATIKSTTHTGKDAQNILTKTGQIQAEDVNELLTLVRQLDAFPTDPKKDIYGIDTRLVLSTFEVQWDSAGEVEGEGEVSEENKKTFKDVVDSVLALARQSAK